MSEEKEQQTPEQETEESQAGMDTFFSEYSVPVEVNPQKKGLSKNTKALLGAVIALVVVGGALTTVLIINQKEKEAEETGSVNVSSLAEGLLDDDEKNAVSLNEESADDVKEVQIVNQDKFRVYQVSAKTDSEKAVYTIEGYEDIPLDSGYLSTLVNNASMLSAIKLVEESPSDLAKYGLSEPVSKVKMLYQDGTEFQFSVGMADPMNKEQTYCEVNGSVYLIKTSLMANYQKSLDFFLSKVMLEKPADDNYPIVKSLRIQRENLDYDMYMEYDYQNAEDDSVGGTASTHIMKEPVIAYLNVEKSKDVTNGMFGLTAEKIVKVHPSESDLKDAGISQPFCTVTMECDDGKTYLLKFGKTYTSDEGDTLYYAYLDGTDILYGVAETRAVWTTVQPGDITSANIFGTYVWDIANLDVKAGDKELHFVGEGTEQKDYTVTKNGESCETERFRQLYKFFLNIYGEELYFDAEVPKADPDAEIHVKTQDGKSDYTVAFYRLGGLNALITVNGKPTYKIRSSCIDTILHNVEIFDNPEEEFVMTWQ